MSKSGQSFLTFILKNRHRIFRLLLFSSIIYLLFYVRREIYFLWYIPGKTLFIMVGCAYLLIFDDIRKSIAGYGYWFFKFMDKSTYKAVAFLLVLFLAVLAKIGNFYPQYISDRKIIFFVLIAGTFIFRIRSTFVASVALFILLSCSLAAILGRMGYVGKAIVIVWGLLLLAAVLKTMEIFIAERQAATDRLSKNASKT